MPPNYVFWLTRESLTLTQAVFLLCGDTPSDEREGERPSAEHHEVERWIRQRVPIIKVPAPEKTLMGGPSPLLRDGVRVADLVDALRQQDPLTWGRDIVAAARKLKSSTTTPKPTMQQRREDSMRRYLKAHPREHWLNLTSVKQWAEVLRQWDRAHFTIELDTFDRFWKNRAPGLKEAVQLKDKSL